MGACHRRQRTPPAVQPALAATARCQVPRPAEQTESEGRPALPMRHGGAQHGGRGRCIRNGTDRGRTVSRCPAAPARSSRRNRATRTRGPCSA
jgi:hypothetical protein